MCTVLLHVLSVLSDKKVKHYISQFSALARCITCRYRQLSQLGETASVWNYLP